MQSSPFIAVLGFLWLCNDGFWELTNGVADATDEQFWVVKLDPAYVALAKIGVGCIGVLAILRRG